MKLLLLTGLAFAFLSPLAAAEKTPGPNGHQLVPVKAGTYQLGEKDHAVNPAHKAKLAAFSIADAETTTAQFARFVEATGYKTDAERRGFGKTFHEGLADWKWIEQKGANWRVPFGPDHAKAADDHPVTQISGADAIAYCKWVDGRLPTCDEWEVAARAGATGKWPWGAGWMAGKSNVWNGKNHGAETKADGFTYTAPVRSYAPNAWGLYDTIGNVFEYCADLPKPYRGREKVLISGRGGSWWCSEGTCNFYNLVDIGRMDRRGSLANQGFRVVFDVKPEGKARAK